MELILKISVLCVLVSLLALLLKKGTPELALLLALVTAVAAILSLADTIGELTAFFRELGAQSGIAAGLLTPLYKTLGIALVVHIGAGLCRDAEESALAAVVETAGTVCAFLAALPLMRQVFQLLLELLQ